MTSVSFPLISTGSFGYPREEGMRIAIDEINAFLLTHDMMIYLVVFDDAATKMGQNIDPDLEAYIDRHYVSEKSEEEYEQDLYTAYAEAELPPDSDYSDRKSAAKPVPGRKADTRDRRKAEPAFGKAAKSPVRDHLKQSSLRSGRPWSEDKDRFRVGRETYPEAVEAARPPVGKAAKPSLRKETEPHFPSQAAKKMSIEEEDAAYKELERKLDERMEHLADTFSQYLFYLIGQKGLKNADVHKHAIVDKKVFSKIKNNPDYHPQKQTALRLCIGAMLNIDETKDLLARAGYALSPCDKTDIIFSYFIENGMYDIIDLDIQLEEHGLQGIIN